MKKTKTVKLGDFYMLPTSANNTMKLASREVEGDSKMFWSVDNKGNARKQKYTLNTAMRVVLFNMEDLHKAVLDKFGVDSFWK